MTALTEEDIRGLQVTLRELQERVGNLATTSVQLQNSLQAERANRAQAEDRFAQEIQGARQQAANAQAAAAAAIAARPVDPRLRDDDGLGGGIRTIPKWAPDAFTGRREDWPSWSVKFRAFMGAMQNDQVGLMMDAVRAAREQRDGGHPPLGLGSRYQWVMPATSAASRRGRGP